ncbi:MAG: DUF6220 domain-containing protein [Gaiellaceae bacterium]
MRWAGAAHRWLLTVFIVGVAVQFFLAGLGVFRVDHVATKTGTALTEDRFDNFFDPHVALGNILFLVAILVFLAALLARVGRPRIFAMLALPVLVFLQSIFANTGPSWFRALHVLNAFVIAGLAGAQTGLAWQEKRAASAGGAGVPADAAG